MSSFDRMRMRDQLAKSTVRECLDLLSNPDITAERRLELKMRISQLVPVWREPLDWSTEP